MDTAVVALILGIVWTVVSVLVVGPIAFILKRTLADLHELEKNFQALERDLPLFYVRQDDYHRDIEEIKAILAKIFEKLEAMKG